MAITTATPKDGHAGPADRFDFLGYRFSAAGLVGVAMQTVQRCVERMNRLYEHGADYVRIGDYVRRWSCAGRSGLTLGCDPMKRAILSDGSLVVISFCCGKV